MTQAKLILSLLLAVTLQAKPPQCTTPVCGRSAPGHDQCPRQFLYPDAEHGPPRGRGLQFQTGLLSWRSGRSRLRAKPSHAQHGQELLPHSDGHGRAHDSVASCSVETVFRHSARASGTTAAVVAQELPAGSQHHVRRHCRTTSRFRSWTSGPTASCIANVKARGFQHPVCRRHNRFPAQSRFRQAVLRVCCLHCAARSAQPAAEVSADVLPQPAATAAELCTAPSL